MADLGRLTGSERLGLTMMAGGIIVSLILAKPIRLSWQKWGSERLNWKQNTAKLAQLNELKQAREDLEPQYQEVEALLVVGEVGAAAAAQNLETAAADNQVNLSLTFDDFPEKVDVGGMYQQGLAVKAELTGTYQGILNWTAAVERLPYLIRWDEIKLGQARQEGSIKAEYRGVLFLKE